MSNKNIIICIDLSCDISGFSIFNSDNFLIKKYDFYSKSAFGLFIEKLILSLNEINLSMNNVDRWIVGLGPGNFNRLRMLSAFVSGYCCLNKKSDSYGISSALPISMRVADKDQNIEKIIVLFCGSIKYITICEVIIEMGVYNCNKINYLDHSNLILFLNNHDYDKIAYVKNNYINDMKINEFVKKQIIMLDDFPTENMLNFNLPIYKNSIRNLIYVRDFIAN